MFRVPKTWSIDTSNLIKMEKEIVDLKKRIEANNWPKLHGDSFCDARDYKKWANNKIKFLDRMIETS